MIFLVFLLLLACAPAARNTGKVPVEVLVNAVEGGKNTRDVEWLRRMEPILERQLPEVDVRIRTDGGSDESYKAKLVLDLYGGRGSDVISFDSFWTAGMASAGLLQELPAWEEWKHFPTSMREMGSYEGKTYLVPFLTDVRGLYYRKDLFQRAGIPLPWRPRSWEDIYAAGEALKKLPGVIPIQWNGSTAYGEAATMQGIGLVLLSAGGDLYAGGRWLPAGLEPTLDFYREIYVRRKLGDVSLQLDPKGRERSFELFRDGKIGIYPEGTYMWLGVLQPGQSWGIPNRDEVVDWAPMPRAENGGAVSLSGGNGYILNKNSRHPEAAWQVLQALASRESQRIRMEIAPFVPPRTDLFELITDPVLKRQLEEALPVTRFRPGLPLYPKVSERLQEAAERVIRGEEPEASVQELRRQVQQLAE